MLGIVVLLTMHIRRSLGPNLQNATGDLARVRLEEYTSEPIRLLYERPNCDPADFCWAFSPSRVSIPRVSQYSKVGSFFSLSQARGSSKIKHRINLAAVGNRPQGAERGAVLKELGSVRT